MDIKQSETLTREGARDDDDERHICPLQEAQNQLQNVEIYLVLE
jgi:hypothetical protein